MPASFFKKKNEKKNSNSILVKRDFILAKCIFILVKRDFILAKCIFILVKRDSILLNYVVEVLFIYFFNLKSYTQSMIWWLIATKPHKHLSNHFILKFEQKFMVFTSQKNITGSRLISNVNIENRTEAQYIVEKVHQVDPATMIITKAEKGVQFYIKHQEILQPFIEKLSQ